MIYSSGAISAEVGKQYPFISNIQQPEEPCRTVLSMDLKRGEVFWKSVFMCKKTLQQRGGRETEGKR